MLQKRREERRQFHRHRMRREMEFSPLGEGALAPKGKERGVMINRSSGGLCISVTAPLRQKQVLRLSIPLGTKKNKKTTAPTLGEIRWVRRKVLNRGGYLVGVRYLL